MAVAATPTDGPAARAQTPVAPPGATRWLLVALVCCMLYANFADGATVLPQEAWVQLGLAAIATAACAGWLFGNGLRVGGSRIGWLGLGLLVAFAVWTAATILFSVAPDRSWAAANRVIAYALIVWCGIVLGASSPRACAQAGLGIAAAAFVAALYALAAKTFPTVSIGPIDFDHAASPNRVKEPLGYWNALALLCALGALPTLRLACDPWRRASVRVGGIAATMIFMLVIGLTYSRGGVIALCVGVAVLVACGTERLRTVVAAVMALIAASVPLGVVLGSVELSSDGVALADRTGPALQVFVATIVAAGVLGALWRAVIGLEMRGTLTPERGRVVGGPLAVLAAGLLFIAFTGALASGQLANAIETFTDPREAAAVTDPNRLLSSTSGNRWSWWLEAIGGWSDRPLTGWGAGSFEVTHLLYRDEPLTVSAPHSAPLQWLTETGLLGFLLGGGAVVALLVAGLMRVRSLPGTGAATAALWRRPQPDPQRAAAAVLLAIGVTWSVHALFDWDWDIPAVTLPALLALGVLVGRPPTGEAPGPRAGAGPVFGCVLAAAVLFAVSAALPAYARSRVDAALETAAGEDGATPEQLTRASRAAALAVGLNPLSVDGLYAASVVAERAGQPDAARRFLLRAIRRQPYSVSAWLELTRVDFLRQDRAAMRREARRALELDPANPTTINLARSAQQNSVLAAESASATGTPLETTVQIGPPPAVPAPPASPTVPLPRIPMPRIPNGVSATSPGGPLPLPPAASVDPSPSPTPSPSPRPSATPTPGPDGRLPPTRTSGDDPPRPEP